MKLVPVKVEVTGNFPLKVYHLTPSEPVTNEQIVEELLELLEMDGEDSFNLDENWRIIPISEYTKDDCQMFLERILEFWNCPNRLSDILSAAIDLMSKKRAQEYFQYVVEEYQK